MSSERRSAAAHFARRQPPAPQIYRTLHGDATSVKQSPTGTVGRLFRGEGMEMVWVSKEHESIDPKWFVSRAVDLLLVIQGYLRVEFENPQLGPQTLRSGDLLVLPPATRCRAYRWPRSARRATVFVAVYPTPSPGRNTRRVHSR